MATSGASLCQASTPRRCIVCCEETKLTSAQPLPCRTWRRIRSSLAKLGKFSGSFLADDASVRAQRAKNLLQAAMQAWAHKRYGESRAAGQYERWEEAKAHGFVEAEGYDAHVVLDTWLRCNRLVEELVVGIIAEARNPIPSNDARTKGNVEPSSAIILAGVELPRLYERYTGKSYGFSTSSVRTMRTAAGLQRAAGRNSWPCAFASWVFVHYP